MPTTYAIPNGRTVFDVKLYTGDGTSPKQVVTGVGFQPDFAWTKTRSIGTQHALYDAVRGAGSGKILLSDTTNAEGGSGGTSDATYGYLSAFNSDGFTTTKGSDATNYFFNNNAQTYVSWLWNAGGSNATNTAGSITSTVRANTTAGFSIVTFNAGSSGSKTVGHGLGVAPNFVIVKDRSNAYTWVVYHSSVVSNVNQYLELNSGNAVLTYSGIWGSSLPTSSVIGVSSGQTFNANANVVAYCFAQVAGYSAFGSYTGNGSSDGPFVYLGFRPRFVMIKRAVSAGTGSWAMYDTSRSPYNVASIELAANESSAEYNRVEAYMDILSNGIKLRNSDNWHNINGDTYIYAAFAENPFKYVTAR